MRRRPTSSTFRSRRTCGRRSASRARTPSSRSTRSSPRRPARRCSPSTTTPSRRTSGWSSRVWRVSSPARCCRSRTPPSSRTTARLRNTIRAAVPDDRLSRYAELILRVGCNLQPGQDLFLEAKVEHVDFVRCVTEQAYRLGASYVHVVYTDEHVRHALIEHAPDEALSRSPAFVMRFFEDAAERKAALLGIRGEDEPNLLADLDGERVGRAHIVDLSMLVGQAITDQA